MHKILRAESSSAVSTGPDCQGSPSLSCQVLPKVSHRERLEGSEERAREAAQTDGISVRYGWRCDEFDTFKDSMLEERLEQVREIDGELAYEKMRRALEKASQEKARQAREVEWARQVERKRMEWAMQETARQSRDRRGPERGGPERDFGPSR